MELEFNQIKKVETYYYTETGKIDYIESITTYPILNFGYLCFKFFIGFVVFYLAIKIFNWRKK